MIERYMPFVTCAAALALTTACLTGPTQGQASSPNQNTVPPEAAAPSEAPASPSAPLLVWDGDTQTNGKGWASCGKKDGCTTSVEAAAGAGHSGAGIKFHSEGPEWVGMGWNWFGWWPATGGHDISGYKELTFKVKVVAANPKEAPDPNSLVVGLVCSAGGLKDDSKKDTDDAKVIEFTPNVADGQWHDVAIPLSVFFIDKGKDFDKKTAWEMRLSTWSQEARKFDVYVDDIAFR